MTLYVLEDRFDKGPQGLEEKINDRFRDLQASVGWAYRAMRRI